MAKTMTSQTLAPGSGWTVAVTGPLAARLRNEGPVRVRLRLAPATPAPDPDAAGETLEPGMAYGEVALEAGEALWLRSLSTARPALLTVSTDDAGFAGGAP